MLIEELNSHFAKPVLPAVFCQQEEELIANYMGEKATGGYHQSWDWLMPVVVKINANGFSFFGKITLLDFAVGLMVQAA